MEWKWSLGEKYERSSRHPRRAPEDIVPVRDIGPQQQALLSEEDDWNMGLHLSFEENANIPEYNKRELSSNKMSERELIGQIGMNPFMQNKNYLQDVMTHANFLTPQSTNVEKNNPSTGE
jgi:hypothetical protein